MKRGVSISWWTEDQLFPKNDKELLRTNWLNHILVVPMFCSKVVIKISTVICDLEFEEHSFVSKFVVPSLVGSVKGQRLIRNTLANGSIC